VCKLIWQEAASPSCLVTPRCGECIRRWVRGASGTFARGGRNALNCRYVTMQRHMFPHKCPFPWRSGFSSNAWFPETSWVSNLNGI